MPSTTSGCRIAVTYISSRLHIALSETQVLTVMQNIWMLVWVTTSATTMSTSDEGETVQDHNAEGSPPSRTRLLEADRPGFRMNSSTRRSADWGRLRPGLYRVVVHDADLFAEASHDRVRYTVAQGSSRGMARYSTDIAGHPCCTRAAEPQLSQRAYERRLATCSIVLLVVAMGYCIDSGLRLACTATSGKSEAPLLHRTSL
ncbi:uncharacterized protein B0H18DRAFT_1022061 [Fomitopsis serialis]|uniref:uncharacterized protein n=1 Tax=Fomitopsis serialis TaxID=139415 RepID=UPI00200790F9|nr:uncharacterized protein B0H18DRAFT_1022061 [Neoantrodia serialis]KAH9921131.1 hypothetical protein B0H18DRAFT_1022061 [Neoantrodia serialis]